MKKKPEPIENSSGEVDFIMKFGSPSIDSSSEERKRKPLRTQLRELGERLNTKPV